MAEQSTRAINRARETRSPVVMVSEIAVPCWKDGEIVGYSGMRAMNTKGKPYGTQPLSLLLNGVADLRLADHLESLVCLIRSNAEAAESKKKEAIRCR